MKTNEYTISQQIQRNLLAIISLVVAITALSYNTWRNETTEENRNIRVASFEILMNLGNLQLITDYAHYDRNTEQGNPITGWGYIAMIEDLSFLLMPTPIPEMSTELKQIWSENWQKLGSDPNSVKHITNAINAMRETVKSQLKTIN